MAVTITCYIADDEMHAIETLARHIAKTAGLTLLGSSTSPLTALDEIARLNPAVVFLDIDMPELNGLQLARLLENSPQVVFVSGLKEYGPEAFEAAAADYLLKPFSYERFLRCIARLRKNVGTISPGHDFLFLKTGTKGRLEKIFPMDIIFITSALNYVEIHFKERMLVCYLNFADLLEKLPQGQFLRIHKSYLVNVNAINILEYAQLSLSNGKVLPIGRVFRDKLQQELSSSFLFSKRETP